MKSHADVIALWPTAAAFAQDVGAGAPAVRYWKRLNRIPPRHFDAVLAAAERRGFAPITYAQLSQWAQPERNRSDAEEKA